MSTEILVLAAGRGARLGHHSAKLPKWLLEVGGSTIAERQLEAIERASRSGGISSVRVVTGHCAEEIDRFLAGRDGIEVGTVYNPEYARLNNWYSVLLGLRTRAPEIERVVVVNADLFAATEWLEAFFDDAALTPEESLIGIDLERRLADESMKVAISPGNAGAGSVAAIGKIGVEDPAGEYVGLLMAARGVLDEFRAALESFVDDPDASDAWYEQAVEATAARGAQWRVWPTRSSRWVEIDDETDIAAAVAIERER